MTDRFLVDTNILVYAYDRAYPFKQKKSLEILDRLITGRVCLLSTQILSEFFQVVTKKIKAKLSVKDAESQVDNLIRSVEILDITPIIVLEAIRGVRERKFSYWDSQIWATARLNQVPYILTENFHRGSVEGVRFINPFEEEMKIR